MRFIMGQHNVAVIGAGFGDEGKAVLLNLLFGIFY